MRHITPVLLGLFLACNVHAAHRTFVAASGVDGGTCGPIAPCRTLDYAMSQTDSGGEVVITESGGYGSSPSGGITITKSISIIAESGIYAALAPTSGYDGITINTGGIKVVIKGLNINNRGGTNGINMTSGSSLVAEKVAIAGFSATGAAGIMIQTAATVNIVDAVIRDSTNGIYAGAGATVGVSSSKIINNPSAGIGLFTPGTATGVTTTINVNDTVVSGSGFCVASAEKSGNTGMINATRVSATQCESVGFWAAGVGSNKMTVSGSSSSNNGIGFLADSATSILIVSGSTASNNTVGFYRNAGTFATLYNNTVYGNLTNVSGTITYASLQ